MKTKACDGPYVRSRNDVLKNGWFVQSLSVLCTTLALQVAILGSIAHARPKQPHFREQPFEKELGRLANDEGEAWDLLRPLLEEQQMLELELRPFWDQQHQVESQLQPLLQRQSQLEAELKSLMSEQTRFDGEAQNLSEKRSQLDDQAKTLNHEKSRLEADLQPLAVQQTELESQLRPLLNQKVRLESELRGLVQQQAEFETELLALPELQRQLETEGQRVGAEINQVRAQQQSVSAQIGQLEARERQLRGEYNQKRSSILNSPECKSPEYPPEICQESLDFLDFEYAIKVQAVRNERDQLIATQGQLKVQEEQLQSDLAFAQDRLELTKIREEFLRDAIPDTRHLQQETVQALAENATARKPIEERLLENSRARQPLEAGLAENASARERVEMDLVENVAAQRNVDRRLSDNAVAQQKVNADLADNTAAQGPFRVALDENAKARAPFELALADNAKYREPLEDKLANVETGRRAVWEEFLDQYPPGVTPTVSDWNLRKMALITETPAIFPIEQGDIPDEHKWKNKWNKELPYPDPWYAVPALEQVTQYSDLIEAAARRHGIDPNIAKAIMWIETTHGWYDFLNYIKGSPPDTVRPMNVSESRWLDIGVSWEDPDNPQIRPRSVESDFTSADLNDPKSNIEVGVFLLSEIAKRIEEPTIEQVATLYNDLRRTKVSGYGWTVGIYYREKVWERQRSP